MQISSESGLFVWSIVIVSIMMTFSYGCGNINEGEGVYPEITRGDLYLTNICPAPNSKHASRDAIIVLEFNKTIRPQNANRATIILGSGRAHIRGNVQAIGNSITYIPTTKLEWNTRYDIYITSTLRDEDGFSVTDDFVVYSFETGNEQDADNTCREHEPPAL